jgi:hypothetical protein
MHTISASLLHMPACQRASRMIHIGLWSGQHDHSQHQLSRSWSRASLYPGRFHPCPICRLGTAGSVGPVLGVPGWTAGPDRPRRRFIRAWVSWSIGPGSSPAESVGTCVGREGKEKASSSAAADDLVGSVGALLTLKSFGSACFAAGESGGSVVRSRDASARALAMISSSVSRSSSSSSPPSSSLSTLRSSPS